MQQILKFGKAVLKLYPLPLRTDYTLPFLIHPLDLCLFLSAPLSENESGEKLWYVSRYFDELPVSGLCCHLPDTADVLRWWASKLPCRLWSIPLPTIMMFSEQNSKNVFLPYLPILSPSGFPTVLLCLMSFSKNNICILY